MTQRNLTPEQIAARAYQLYLERGRTDGHDFDDWLQAEYELRQLPVRKLAELEPPRGSTRQSQIHDPSLTLSARRCTSGESRTVQRGGGSSRDRYFPSCACLFMKLAMRFTSTAFDQRPSVLKCDPTMNPSASVEYFARFCAVTPVAEIDWQVAMFFGRADVRELGRIACDEPGDDHCVAAHELDRFRRLADADVRRDGVRTVFLLHVGPDLHAIGADLFAVAEQGAADAWMRPSSATWANANPSARMKSKPAA